MYMLLATNQLAGLELWLLLNAAAEVNTRRAAVKPHKIGPFYTITRGEISKKKLKKIQEHQKNRKRRLDLHPPHRQIL
jgi:hypothetical protein